jgi:Rod binding domain-containing protein
MVNKIYNFQSINYNIAKDVKSPEQKQLYKACTEFEAMLVKQMLQTMQSSTDLFGKGFGGGYYKDMFQDKMAKQVADQGMGLAKSLYEQIIKTNNIK